MRRTVRPPALPPARAATLPHAERLELRSGLVVHLVERHALPIVELLLVLRAGADLDLPGEDGCASLAAALLSEGTRVRDGRDFADELDALGATFDAHAGWDETSLSLHVLRPRLEPALALFTEALAEPAFAEAALAQKLRERLVSLLQERSDPRALASRAFVRAAYRDAHRYARPREGGEESVAHLTTRHVRGHCERWYSPSNAFLVVVGDITPAELGPMLERTLGQWRAPAIAPPPPVPGANSPERSIVLVERADSPQSELRVGHASVPRNSPDYFPLTLLNTVLGGAFTSRINIRLREEKGYTYGASSTFSFRRGPGPFLVSTAVDSAATDAAVSDILAELERVRAEPVSEAELERARRYLVLGLGREWETTSGVAEHIAEQELHDLGEGYFASYAEQLGAVTAASMQAAAVRHLHAAAAAIAVVGEASCAEALRAREGAHIVLWSAEQV